MIYNKPPRVTNTQPNIMILVKVVVTRDVFAS